ncbi:MAG: type II toxin-antitoxin system Phd/YefM family antitoxin [Thiohalomonadales bacterium]
MKSIAAKEAKNNFGELMDTAQREPVTIERHGRAVAVVMSANEYDKIKLERLRAKLVVGQTQLENGESITLNTKEERHEFFEDIKKRGKERVEGRKK